MSQVLDLVAPRRLGRDFRYLLTAAWTTNLADGVLLAAGPLLIASLTHDPLVIALAAAARDLPWLLFGLYAGFLADRLDRRRMLIGANVVRIGLLAGLTTMVVSGTVTVAVVLGALLCLGIAETFEDSVAGTLAPMIVPAADLGTAAARFQFGQMTMNQLAGPSIGAVLFTAGIALPYATALVLLTAGAILVTQLRLGLAGTRDAGAARHDAGGTDPRRDPDPDARPEADEAGPRSAWRQVHDEIAEGIRWLWRHDAVRTLALVIFVFNITFGAAWSVLVLYARTRLGLPPSGYGALLSVSAAGGVVGTLVFTRLERRFALAVLLRAGLVIETLTHLVLALTTRPGVAFAIMFLFGLHASVWGALSTAIRMRAVPRGLQGRVGSVYMLGVIGGMFMGGLAGGGIGRWGGVVAVYWFAFAGSATFLAVMWRAIGHVAHADEARRDPPAPV